MGTVDATVESRARAAVEVLSHLGAVRAAYLFGSHMEGTPDQWSDVDVAVFMEGVEHWDIHQRATAMALVMEKVGNEVEAHLFPASALDDPPISQSVAAVSVGSEDCVYRLRGAGGEGWARRL